MYILFKKNIYFYSIYHNRYIKVINRCYIHDIHLTTGGYELGLQRIFAPFGYSLVILVFGCIFSIRIFVSCLRMRKN